MKRIVDATREFERRLELVRRIARLNARRTQFSRDEELQFIIAARLFTYAELQAMHSEAVDATKHLGSPRDRLAS
jgi:hypothetical protein